MDFVGILVAQFESLLCCGVIPKPRVFTSGARISRVASPLCAQDPFDFAQGRLFTPPEEPLRSPSKKVVKFKLRHYLPGVPTAFRFGACYPRPACSRSTNSRPRLPPSPPSSFGARPILPEDTDRAAPTPSS